MKRVFLFLLVLCTLLTVVPVISVSASETEMETKDATLPSSFTLVGTEHLPPISNQGNIGTCSSSSITYMQFSNAVSRYLHSIDPDIEWNPSSGEAQYLFSPKFTYNYAGSGTEWVYRILMENGCLTWDRSFFDTKADGSYNQEAVMHVIPTQTSSWDVKTGDMETALKYRLNNFEQIWLRTTDDSYGVDGNLQITNTEKGQALIQKVKDALIGGNVVVTGGLSSTWGNGYEPNAVVANTRIARKGDSVLYCGRGDKSGGHQVCIVGYDDDIEADVTNMNGEKTRMKGAFLVANSWGEAWQNDGYCWFMYDSMNQISEYPELNFEDRATPLDQFCFVYWDKDVTVEMPDLYLEASVVTSNRTAFSLDILGQNEAGLTKKYTPYLFKYASHHGDYEDRRDFNFTGQPAKNGISSMGQFTFSCAELYGGDINKFVKYGVKITAKGGVEVKLAALTLKDSRGNVIKKVMFTGDDCIVTGEKSFFIDYVPMIAHDELPTVEGATINYLDSANYYADGSKIRFTVTADDKDATVILSLDGSVLKADENGVYTAKLNAASVLSAEFEKQGNVDDNPVDGDNNTMPGNNNSQTQTPSTDHKDENNQDNESSSDKNDKSDENDSSVVLWIVIGGVTLVLVAVVAGILITKKKDK